MNLTILIIAFILTFGYFLNKILETSINTFPAYERFFQSWTKKPLSSVKLSSIDDCFASNTQNLVKFNWPGTTEGCDCHHIRYSWLRQHFFKQYRRKVWNEYCTEIQHKLECINTTATFQETKKKWRNHFLCGKPLDRNKTYFDFIYNNKTNQKPCGILDTLGQQLLVNMKESCPHNDYHFTVNNTFDYEKFLKEKIKFFKAYTRDHARTHETFFFDTTLPDYAGFNYLQMNFTNKDTKPVIEFYRLNSTLTKLKPKGLARIPVGFVVSDNSTICMDSTEHSTSEFTFSLFKEKKNACSIKINNEYISEDSFSHIHDAELEKIENLIHSSSEDTINRFNIKDDYNKYLFYSQNDLIQNFMLSGAYSDLSYTNITLYEEIYIGWNKDKAECVIDKNILTKLMSRYKTFRSSFTERFKDIGLMKFNLIIILTIKLIILLFSDIFNRSKKFNNLTKKKKILFVIWVFLIIAVALLCYYQIANIIINNYKDYNDELYFISLSRFNCSDDYSNILLSALHKEITNNIEVFHSIASAAIVFLGISGIIVVIQIKKILSINENVLIEVGRKYSNESTKKLSPMHKSFVHSESDTESVSSIKPLPPKVIKPRVYEKPIFKSEIDAPPSDVYGLISDKYQRGEEELGEIFNEEENLYSEREKEVLMGEKNVDDIKITEFKEKEKEKDKNKKKRKSK